VFCIEHAAGLDPDFPEAFSTALKNLRAHAKALSTLDAS